MIQNLNSIDFEKTINQATELILVDFHASIGCPACDTMKPILEDLSKELTDVLIVKIDVKNKENESLFIRYGIRHVPSLLLFKEGNILDKQIGKTSKMAMIDFIEKHKYC